MSVAANRYAKALIEALPPEKTSSGLEELSRFIALLEEEPSVRRLFENPTVPSDKRKALLEEISEALDFSTPVRNFVSLVIERKRLDILEEIVKSYQKLLDEKLGIVRASVTVAHPLDSAAHKELAAKLAGLTGKNVRMEVAVDPSLLGGVIARVGGTIYDGSLRQQLKAFKSRLVQE